MKLDGIASFVAVAEEGSISGAARTLRLSKSVVSERLTELERSLGATLLHRTTRKMSVTEDGTAFLERAKRILREVSEAATDLAERRGTLSGPMRISAPVTFGRMHLGPALYPFLAANPEIEMSLELDDRRVDIASGIYDAVVRHGAIDDSRLMVWRLAPSRRVLVASGDYLASRGTPATIEQLDAHKGIFYINRGVADWRFATSTGIEIVRARVGVRVNNGDMMRDAAIAGLGIALLPLFICGPDIRNGKLKVVDLGVQPTPEFIYIAHPEGRRPSAKLRALAEHLKAAFGEPPYWEDRVI
ncbi:MAG: LysR family transcriptional regulator [Mesorhizobium sp.]|uniref:LysR family transcriptional regulator n=1 Tax=Mesorhizobium sp. TaxID=1871066 RepID=UPI000FE40370|nr:LysR family transcriptional regulator [Mesorhizobium sp.]RWA76435.1 MAG: LysR family transcriptional regulator [Mesorhizobium sp.]RWB98595.1 MAG: LysR family transcriptional regulator [Mesorhizobium sp.]RWG87393.1 MAG: LysR family transcriptional regulator [Mesorhizobium sp.]RWJ96094.1 MAG: LysR family transcriptional regulator [Mesorhizobium sp.]RWK10553.1 MAG: LysR family transcriptional regulator [Mesorhizobium sp.]